MQGNAPLAERMRPTTLDGYVGQAHLVGEGAVLRQAMRAGTLPSMILWGPPGVGKTTLARLIAQESGRPFHSLSAIHSGVKDVRNVLDSVKRDGMFAGRALLFIDEIHRFSKSQQDSLLGAVEAGTVTLLGATTENPSFEVIPALRSRCQTYVLEPLSAEVLQGLMARALSEDESMAAKAVALEETEALLRASGGDARRLLNTLELVVDSLTPDADGRRVVTNDKVLETIQNTPSNYDKGGEQHYDVVSAFIKSIGQRPQCRRVLFGPHGGRGRGSQVHRTTPLDFGFRRHRQRQPHGVGAGQQHVRCGGADRLAGSPDCVVAMRRVFGHKSQEQRLLQGHWAGTAMDSNPWRSGRALGAPQRPDQAHEGLGLRERLRLRPRSVRAIQRPGMPAEGHGGNGVLRARQQPTRAGDTRVAPASFGSRNTGTDLERQDFTSRRRCAGVCPCCSAPF